MVMVKYDFLWSVASCFQISAFWVKNTQQQIGFLVLETGNLEFKKRSRFNLALIVNSTPQQGFKNKQRRFIMQSNNIVN